MQPAIRSAKFYSVYCLATLLFIAGISPRSAAAQETKPIAETYKGWVEIADSTGTTVEHRNVQTGTSVRITRETAEEGGALPAIQYANPETREITVYDARTKTIRTGPLEQTAEQMLRHQFPVTADALFSRVREIHGDRGVIVRESLESDTLRYEVLPDNTDGPRTFRQTIGISLPFSLQVDPKTKLIRQKLSGHFSETYTYGLPPINSIYEAGAPRDAKVIKNTPPPEAVGIYDRLMARIAKPWPDGLSVFVIDRLNGPSELILLGSEKDRWFRRLYGEVHPANKAGEGIALPLDWAGAEHDAFLRLVSISPFASETAGDAKEAYSRSFRPNNEWRFLDEVAANMRRANSPQTYLYLFTEVLRGRYGNEWQLEAFTPEGRPELTGIRSKRTSDAGKPLDIMETLFEVAHDDRVMHTIDEHYEDAGTGALRTKIVTEYLDYQQHPLPDGRWYARTRKTTVYEPNEQGALAVTSTQTWNYRFFAGEPLQAVAPPECLP